MKTDYEFCILTNEKNIIEHEKELYNSYLKKNKDGWVANTYKIIDNCQLRANYSYKDQVVYALKNNKNIIVGGSILINVKEEFMLEKMGFVIDKSGENFCEGKIYILQSI